MVYFWVSHNIIASSSKIQMNTLAALTTRKKRDIDGRSQRYHLQSTHSCHLLGLPGKLLELLLQILPLLNDAQTHLSSRWAKLHTGIWCVHPLRIYTSESYWPPYRHLEVGLSKGDYIRMNHAPLMLVTVFLNRVGPFTKETLESSRVPFCSAKTQPEDSCVQNVLKWRTFEPLWHWICQITTEHHHIRWFSQHKKTWRIVWQEGGALLICPAIQR